MQQQLEACGRAPESYESKDCRQLRVRRTAEVLRRQEMAENWGSGGQRAAKSQDHGEPQAQVAGRVPESGPVSHSSC
jgi:hypothetical protein